VRQAPKISAFGDADTNLLKNMSKASAPSKTPPVSTGAQDTGVPPASYEEAMQELEALVRRLESGEMPLDQLLSGYQRGAVLLQFCRDCLQAVEDQIKVLDDGTLKVWKAQ
jgi:exodeoxyribonuclease VII small subunit